MRCLAAVVALVAFGVWGWLCWRAMAAPESYTGEGVRTWAFLVMVGAGMVAFPYKRRPDDDERL